MKKILWILILVVLSISVLAHAVDDPVKDATSLAVEMVMIASLVIIALVFASILVKEKTNMVKAVFFITIAIFVLVPTFYVAGSTIYLNVISETKGPVHWHADYEVWNCGEKVDLLDPSGLSNRIGNPVLHDHGDDRMHVEGVVVRKRDVDVYSFFNVIGGNTDNGLSVITNDGILTVKDGELCNGKEAKLQIFAYQIRDGNVLQFKVDEEYILTAESVIPPGDCIIIEFDEEKERTDKLCETYKIAISKGDVNGG